MTYVIAEMASSVFPISLGDWKETKAESLQGAKRAAARKQMFQGTTISVGLKTDGHVRNLSIKNDGLWLDQPGS